MRGKRRRSSSAESSISVDTISTEASHSPLAQTTLTRTHDQRSPELKQRRSASTSSTGSKSEADRRQRVNSKFVPRRTSGATSPTRSHSRGRSRNTKLHSAQTIEDIRVLDKNSARNRRDSSQPNPKADTHHRRSPTNVDARSHKGSRIHRQGEGSQSGDQAPRQQAFYRERSLSPFSKRLALTKAMSQG